jgi:hypothetical protein
MYHLPSGLRYSCRNIDYPAEIKSAAPMLSISSSEHVYHGWIFHQAILIVSAKPAML